MKLNLSSERSDYLFSREAVLVLLLGFIIRLFAFYHTFIVAPDSVLYIHQARALYYGKWEALTSCGLPYLSSYPIFIAGAYKIFHDWVIAGMSVSLFFGSITLILIYFLLKQFFKERISILGTLIFALTPVLVGRSVDVLRDPVYWFFLVFGVFFFVSHIDKRNYLYLFMSSISFLAASWARIEAILFVIISCIFILAVRQKNKIRKFTIFVSPLFIVVLLAVSGASFFEVPINKFHRADQILDKFTGAVDQYKNIRESLAELAHDQHENNLQFFLPEARNTIWLIALGVLLNRSLEAFFYPYFLVVLIGLIGIWKKINSDLRVLYCFLLAASGLILLYVHILQTWMMYYRFLAIVIFPSFIFAGYGLEHIIHWLRSRFNLKKSVAYSIVCFLILISALPKNLQKRGADKIVFRQIAEVISDREDSRRVIEISTSRHTYRWISFYTNLNYKGAPCPELTHNATWGKYANDYGKLLLHLKKRGVKYFLWEEKHWPIPTFKVNESPYSKNFKALGRWYHRDTGQMILFAVS
jgi:4-amino-4-deoxy-L-arabinose transferase-like glycosyltransferase